MVSRGADLLFKGYFGPYRAGDPLEPGSYIRSPIHDPPDDNTLFDLASLTKALATTPLILRLIEEGKLELASRLGDILKGLSSPTARLTIESLLTHSSGLPSLPDLWQRFSPGDNAGNDARELLYTIEPVIESGQRIIYSCTGFLFLGEVIHKLTGRNLKTAFAGLIDDSGSGPFTLGYLPPRSLYDSCAPTEFCSWRQRRIQGDVHDENAYVLGGAAGNAGLFGTLPAVHEHVLRLWGFAMGADLKDSFLEIESVRMAATARSSLPLGASLQGRPSGEMEHRGLGLQVASETWQRETGFSSSSFGHTGFTGTSFRVDPQRALSVTILTNRLYYGRDASALGITEYRNKVHRSVVRRYG